MIALRKALLIKEFSFACKAFFLQEYDNLVLSKMPLQN